MHSAGKFAEASSHVTSALVKVRAAAEKAGL